MKKEIFFFVLLLTFFSCRKEEPVDLSNTCSVANPLEELEWLKDKIEKMEEGEPMEGFGQSVSMAEYNGETVFIFETYCDFCMVKTPVYNCKGEEVCIVGQGKGCPDFLKVARNKRVIWWSEGFGR